MRLLSVIWDLILTPEIMLMTHEIIYNRIFYQKKIINFYINNIITAISFSDLLPNNYAIVYTPPNKTT